MCREGKDCRTYLGFIIGYCTLRWCIIIVNLSALIENITSDINKVVMHYNTEFKVTFN